MRNPVVQVSDGPEMAPRSSLTTPGVTRAIHAGRFAKNYHQVRCSDTIDHMPRDFFLRIASTPLPFHSEDPYEIDCILVLQAAGLIHASIETGDVNGEREKAVVCRITELGQAELERLRRSAD